MFQSILGLALALYAAGNEARLDGIRQECRAQVQRTIKPFRDKMRQAARRDREHAAATVRFSIRLIEDDIADEQKNLAHYRRQRQRGRGSFLILIASSEKTLIYWQEYKKAYEQLLNEIQPGGVPAPPKKK
jgi:hypothetical protein